MTQTIIKYLRQYPEKMPTWLMNYRPGDYVSFGDVMSGRVGYYPGSDFDGQLIKVGSASHSVHSFIYVDYWITEDDLELLAKGELESEIWPPLDKQGYSIIGRQEWNIKEILSPDEPCFEFKRKPKLGPPSLFRKNSIRPYCIMFVWERDKNKDETWGVRRIATTFICADAITAYYSIFSRYRKAPWILLLQDHALGCNYDSFGKGGLLDEIIITTKLRPEFLLWNKGDTMLWDGYKELSCVPDIGGLYRTPRYLCQNIDTN